MVTGTPGQLVDPVHLKKVTLVDKEQVVRLLELDEAARYQQAIDAQSYHNRLPAPIAHASSRLRMSRSIDEDEVNPIVHAIHIEEHTLRSPCSSYVSTTSSDFIDLDNFVLNKPPESKTPDPAKSWFESVASVGKSRFGSFWKHPTNMNSRDAMCVKRPDASLPGAELQSHQGNNCLTNVSSEDDHHRVEQRKEANKLGQETSTLSPVEPESLIGYWSWKNSIAVHKMELHLGPIPNQRFWFDW